MKPHVTISLLSLLLGALTLNAQTSGTYGSKKDSATTSTSATTKLSMGDKHFVTKTADGNQAEVKLAQLAADRATNPDVKSFAQKLVTDHTAVGQELATLASNKGITLEKPKNDGEDHTYHSFAKKTGADFDKDFVEHMIDEHQKEIKEFEKVASDAKDADIRAFASKHVADLKNHLEMAQNLKSTVAPTGRMDKNSGRSTSTSSSTDTNYSSGTSNSSGNANTSSVNGTTGTSNQTNGSGTSGASSDTTRRNGSR